MLAIFAATALPVFADEVMPPPGVAEEPEGILCMDDMETEPYSDEREPLAVSHIDGGCSFSELPISV
jgi:hypothetical protein